MRQQQERHARPALDKNSPLVEGDEGACQANNNMCAGPYMADGSGPVTIGDKVGGPRSIMHHLQTTDK